MARKIVLAVLILSPVLPLACAVSSHWWTTAVTFGVDQDSEERKTHSFIYSSSSLKNWPNENPAFRSPVLADLGNVDSYQPYVFLEIVDGWLFVHRQKRAPKRLDSIPFLGVEELVEGNTSTRGGRITHYQSSARIPLTRNAGVLAVPLMLMMVIAFARGRYRRFLRHRREKSGLCISCGYNLEGNVSGVCPECGRGEGASQK